MSDNSVSLHRVFAAPVEKLYRAFTEAPAMASWLPPYGFTCTVQELDVKEGGKYHMAFQNFSTGSEHGFGGKYLEVKKNEFLKYADSFDDPKMPGEIITSVWFKKNMAGTEVKILQENLPAAIPAEMCYLGWQDSLDKLMRLVGPSIPDGPEAS